MLADAALPAVALDDQGFLSVDVLMHNASPREKAANLLVFRYQGQVYAYINHCMHMQRPLNCQQDAIFYAKRRWLRCSMHGFIFEPETGVCISPVCEGQKLQAIRVVEQDSLLVFKEKNLRILAVKGHHSAASGR